MAHDIFISHAADPEQSRQVANGIVHELESRGLRCWIAPRDMDAGEDYMAQLSDRVSESQALVLVFTAEANKSPHVKREVGLAFENEVPILPFRVQDVQPDRALKYCIGQVHWLDALTPPLEAHIRDLANRVETLLAGGDREHIEHIRDQKGERRWWRAVVWTMKHGGAAVGIAAVLILAVIGFIGWRVSQFIPGPDSTNQEIQRMLEQLPNTAIQDRVPDSAPATPADLVSQVAGAFVCSYGSCVVNRIRRFPEEISRVYFGTSRDELDRYIDVEAERSLEAKRTESFAVHYYPVYTSTNIIFIQVETVDGERSEVKEVRLQAGSGDFTPYGTLVRLELEDGPGDMSDPGALLASQRREGNLRLFLGSPSDVQSVEYAFDEGGFYQLSADQRFQGRPQVFELNLPTDALTLRARYELSDGEMTDTFRFALPSMKSVEADEHKRILGDKLAEIVACARITGELPVASDSSNVSRHNARIAQQRLQASLMGAGIRDLDVKSSGVTLCAPHWLNSAIAGADAAWSTVKHLEFRTDNGTKMSAPVSGAGGYGQVSWSIEIPELARGVYARIVFADGSRSEEVRIPVTAVEIS